MLHILGVILLCVLALAGLAVLGVVALAIALTSGGANPFQ